MSRLLVALALCPLLASCMSITEGSRSVAVNLSVDRAVVSQATPAAITITMVNYGATAIEVADPRSYACMPPYEVAGASGRSIQLPGRVCDLISFANVLLAPGDTLTVRDSWSGDQANGAFGSVPAPPGEYRLSARLVGQGGFITSAPIDVLVTAPE